MTVGVGWSVEGRVTMTAAETLASFVRVPKPEVVSEMRRQTIHCTAQLCLPSDNLVPVPESPL